MFSGIRELTRGTVDARGPLARTLRAALCALAVVPTACGVKAEGSTTRLGTPDSARAVAGPIELTDDAGFVVRLGHPARRVISLIPSATETLIAIGATQQLVGRTRYDVAPEVASLPSVGGGVDASAEAIVALHPDLVIAWESDKRQGVRERVLSFGIPVFVLRTQDTSDVFRGLATLGRMTAHDAEASAVAAGVRDTLMRVRQMVAGRPAPSVLYVVFNDPPMTAGPQTFIGQLIALVGAWSVFADATELWPNVSIEQIVRRDPDVLVVPVGELNSNAIERFRKLAGWRDLRAVRTGRVVAVPSDLMSRPSPSIARAAAVLAAALHPELGAGARP